MQAKLSILFATLLFSTLTSPLSTCFGFEGRIVAIITRGGQTESLLYTVAPNSLRIEYTATKWPSPVDILDRNSGALTLLFPHNRSFVRFPAATQNPGTVPGSGQTPRPPGVGPQSSGAPAMPPMPMMPFPAEKLELMATGVTTNLLGLTCARYEIKQRGETMEIWATDQLFPFQPYIQNRSRRFGPQRIEEQWPELVKSRKLFPLRASLRNEQGVERFRFEVTSAVPGKITAPDKDLFQPPPNYHELRPLPF